MKSCEQTKGLSVLDHGFSVRNYFLDLYSHLKYQTNLEYKWRLPNWVNSKLLDYLLPLRHIEIYQVFHDCGKPFCKSVDSEGKFHFPNHAKESYKCWLNVGGSKQIANLMHMDMDIHLLKATEVEEFANRKEAITLLLTGLCEIHANASMFGGLESTSFKIKWKKINQRGKAICNILL